MKLKSVHIKNFRCFDSLSIDLDQQLTVLVAKNGQGKSTVLDAIRIGLWSFVGGFDLAHTGYNDPANAISIDDVRTLKIRNGQMARQLPCKINLAADYEFIIPPCSVSVPLYLLENKDSDELVEISQGQEKWSTSYPWTRFRDNEAKNSKTKLDYGAKYIQSLAKLIQAQIRNPTSSDIELPIFGYYGTGRLWSQKKLTKAKTAKGMQSADFYMRLFGYRDCLEPASSYKHFADWFTWIFESYREDQIKQTEKGLSFETSSKWKDTISVVQDAINDVLQQETGWHDLEYSVSYEKSLILNHDEYGKFKVEQLSDGIRGVLAMVGDIAYRCLKLNPHLGLNAAKEARGVVMIDEVDMHLHPSWQQTILGGLTKAFPKIQFIVTTHSPQVLTTVHAKSIRLLSDDLGVLTPSINTYGEESKVVLEDIMQVGSRPHTEEADLLQRYLQRINQGEIESPEVLQWRQELEKAFGKEYSKLKLADMVISKWKVKRGMA